jgi:hypothetical protein
MLPDGREALLELYVGQRGKEGAAPTRRVLLDLDSTEDPTHGDQEGSYYHGYYGQHTCTIPCSSSTAGRASCSQLS